MTALRVCTNDDVRAALLARCVGGMETGGILIGRYIGAEAIVIDACPPPPDSTCGPAEFFRGTSGVADLLLRHWNADPRTYYIGEWHYHPLPVGPSAEDIEQMRTFAADPSSHCANPIMLLARPDGIFAFVLDDGELVEVSP